MSDTEFLANTCAKVGGHKLQYWKSRGKQKWRLFTSISKNVWHTFQVDNVNLNERFKKDPIYIFITDYVCVVVKIMGLYNKENMSIEQDWTESLLLIWNSPVWQSLAAAWWSPGPA